MLISIWEKNNLGIIIHDIWVPQVPHEDYNVKKKNYVGMIIHEILVPQEHRSAVLHEDYHMKKKQKNNLVIIIHDISVPQVPQLRGSAWGLQYEKNYSVIIIHENSVLQVYSSAIPHEDYNMRKKTSWV